MKNLTRSGLWFCLVMGCTSGAMSPGSDDASLDTKESGAGGSSSGGAVGSGGVTATGGNGSGGVASGGHGGNGSGGTAGSGSGGNGSGGAASGGNGGKGSGGAASGGNGGKGAGGAAGNGGLGGSGGAAGTGGRGGSGGTAGGGGGGSTGTAGAASYNPCPTGASPCKILPLGDSITYGVNDEGNAGYRGPLFASAVAAAQKITFTGSLSNGPTTVSGQTFPKNNEGHSGWGISEVTPYSGGNAGISTVIPSQAFSSTSGGVPNIILLHIGTNDAGSFTATQMTSDLTGLLDKIISDSPNALLVVAQIIPLGYGTNDVIKAYNQAIPGIVQQRAAAGKHVALVDMYTGFNTSTMLGSDSIHPNSTGYKFMADHWYSLIGSLLPK
jgi:lysophospholipase L1-like esterase